jgi:hypothetical protein
MRELELVHPVNFLHTRNSHFGTRQFGCCFCSERTSAFSCGPSVGTCPCSASARAVTAPRWRAPLPARQARTVANPARLLQGVVLRTQTLLACPLGYAFPLRVDVPVPGMFPRIPFRLALPPSDRSSNGLPTHLGSGDGQPPSWSIPLRRWNPRLWPRLDAALFEKS